MHSPIDDTIWGRSYGSVAAVEAAFDRFGPEYHQAIMASGAPARAAATLLPFLPPGAQGVDFGCGSGALGVALRDLGWRTPLDGLDLSSGMLELAQRTGAYRQLRVANLLEPVAYRSLEARYDFAVTMGLVGDYVPHYLAVPSITACLRAGAPWGLAVEQRSTSSFALEKLIADLRLTIVSETVLPIPQAQLERQDYAYYVLRLPPDHPL